MSSGYLGIHKKTPFPMGQTFYPHDGLRRHQLADELQRPQPRGYQTSIRTPLLLIHHRDMAR
jgi:hypothetical protein